MYDLILKKSRNGLFEMIAIGESIVIILTNFHVGLIGTFRTSRQFGNPKETNRMTDSIRRKDVEHANDKGFAYYNNSNDCGKSAFVEKNGEAWKTRRRRQTFFQKSFGRITTLVLFSTFLTGMTIPLTVFADRANETDSIAFMEEADWETNYDTAIQKAKDRKRNLLIYFRAEEHSPKLLNTTEEKFVKYGNGTIRQVAHVAPSMQRPLPIAEACRKFEQDVLSDPEVLAHLDDYILLSLSIETIAKDENGETVRLLETPMFKEMEGYPGLAVVDFEHDNQPYYGKLVGILPFLRAQTPDVEKSLTFMNLPPGTVTQRTLIYAIRIHPERPQSTAGTPDPMIMRAAKDHSEYQAKTGVLGHQNFGARSAKISAAMGGGGASEICAQSWSGEGLYEAAIGCVRAWRNSSGHWSSAKRKHTYYGYDMVRGRNNTWFATGLFVD